MMSASIEARFYQECGSDEKGMVCVASGPCKEIPRLLLVARDRNVKSDPSLPDGRSGQETSFDSWLTITAPPPVFFVSVASKGFSNATSPLESTLVKPRGSVDSKGSYVRLSRPITGAHSKRLSAAELSGDWSKKEKREQAPALHM